MRVIGVEQTKLGDEDAYLVHLARARSAEVDEVKCWIAPGKGYAVVRQEVLVLLERFPQAGARSIEKWEDFAFVGDVWVPQTYEKTHYRYTARAGTPTALWDATDRTVLWDIRLGEPVSFSLLDDPVPLGAMPQGVAATEGVSPQEMDSLRQQCMRPWSYWAGFIKAPRPTPDPQFMQPLTGKEIADLKTALGAKP